MELYQKLGTTSQRAISRSSWSGRPYDYRPRGDLLQRLSLETGLTVAQVYQQLMEERAEILRNLP